jgi:serine/threonine protein kinase
VRSNFEVDGYEIEGLLGAGSTGETWLARDVTSGGHVALHRLRPRDAGAVDQARRLVERLGALNHPHVRRIRELLPSDDELVFVLDNLEGGSLEQLLLVRGTLDPGELVMLAATVARALAATHERGLVHGALSPDTIHFTGDGTPIVADIGFAGLVASDDAPGRGGYADPAETDGSEPTQAGDVYSLAAICYTALTGLAPRSGEPPRPIHQVAPGVPPGLAHAVQAGLQSAWDMRPHMSQFAPLLEGASRPVPVRLADTMPEPELEVAEEFLSETGLRPVGTELPGLDADEPAAEVEAPPAEIDRPTPEEETPPRAASPSPTEFPPPTGRPLPANEFPPPGPSAADRRARAEPAPPKRQARQDAERQARQDAERQARQDAERQARQEASERPDRTGTDAHRDVPLGPLQVPPATGTAAERGAARPSPSPSSEPRSGTPGPGSYGPPPPTAGRETGGDQHSAAPSSARAAREHQSARVEELFDVEVGPSRSRVPVVPIAAGAVLLVVAVVVAVLAWRASGGGPSAGPTNPPASTKPATPTPTVSVDKGDPLAVRWAQTLTLFDQRRTNAFARRDPDLLTQLYAPNSQAFAENREYMRELAAANVARVIGLTRQMSSLRTVSTGGKAIVFEVVRQELPYTVAMNDGQQARCPGGPKKKVRIQIVPLEGSTAWRISREWQVGGRTTPEVQVCQPGQPG